ncbi:MAG: tetratricopeptide repeat protein [Alphaproteobacteria bacterium]|nr:tetratricopeptide repeat protein [Alphaproteobacteria bacterium]
MADRPRPTAPALARLLEEAVAHHRRGRIGEAERLYRRVLDADPSQPDALHLLGVVAQQAGRPADAESLIGRAIAIDARVPLYHNNLGVALRTQGRHAEAIAHYRRAVALDPRYGEALVNLGNALDATGASEDALVAYRRALAIDAESAAARTGAGQMLVKLGRAAESIPHFRAAAAAEPTSARVHHNLANALIQAGDLDEAIAALERAVALDPDLVDARRHLGLLLRERDRPADAERHLRAAIDAAPDDVAALHALALCCKDLDRPDEAEALLAAAIAAAPADAMLHGDRANVLKELGRAAEAWQEFDAALALRPDLDSARANRALMRLAAGDFAAGWADYLARATVRDKRVTLARAPLGADLGGQRLLVLRDQGLGDEIFFLRFVATLKERGAWIAYRADPKIAPLLAGLPFIDRLVGADETPEAIDAVLSIGDLPALLGHAASADVPPSIRLAPDPERLARARAQIAALGPGPAIGVTWRAGIQRRNRLSKIGPREGIAAALATTEANVVVLQRAPGEGELAAFAAGLGRPVLDLTALNDDLADMLAALAVIDDYVAVSNTNVHLRAALGRASRVLVPHPAEYRWMDAGATSPWFPDCALYRETVDRGWWPALDRLSADLRRG